MFKQITREEYIILGEAGVKVSVWADDMQFQKHCHQPRWIDDHKYAKDTFARVKSGEAGYRLFYAIVDDELDANPTE